MDGIRYTEPLLEQILQFAPDAIIGIDERGRIVLANAQVEVVFGYERDELIGMQIEALIPLRYRGDHLGHRSRYFEDPRTRPMGAGLDLYGLRSDGTEFPAEISLSSIQVENKVIATAAVRDVTDRKRAETKFRQLLEFAPDAVVGIDTGGLIVLANAQVEKLFGYRRDDVLGQPVEMLVPERYRSGHAGHRSKYFSDPKARAMGAGLELFGLRADDTEFPAEISLSSIQTEEGVIATAAIRDITDRVNADSARQKLEAELKLNQSRRMESVGQLAGGVAHDFNNLLSVILNYSQFIIDGLEAQPGLRDDAVQIQQAAKRAANLTQQLLIFSRRDVVKTEPLALNSILTDLERLLRRTLGEHIELNTNFEDDLWTVMADRGQIEQIVINLAVNARDAMPGGGALHIDTSNVDLDDEFVRFNPDAIPPGRYVRLTVADSGEGMDRETADRAFEPFFSTKPKARGTGLGLATVYGIVKQAGGNVFLYTEVGKGTSFKIHLPASDAPVEMRPARNEAILKGHGERIVVLEDETAVRVMVKRILKASNYEVIQCANGRDAIEICNDRDRDVDLLLTDIVMPNMAGGEVADQARIAQPDLKVLFMSGYSEAIIERQEAHNNITDLLEKPFTAAELLGAVHAALHPSA